jgi:predicted metal-dependent enzyme (double-stranded beta helix superfamily)
MSHPNQFEISTQIENIKKIVQNGQFSRDKLALVEAEVREMAAHSEWWSTDLYPVPVEGELQARYLISEDFDKSYALYLNVMRPGKKIVPHNHTTWACIAAVEGTEFNYVYERTSPNASTLSHVSTVEVTPGTSIGLMPDEIHAVRIVGDQPIRHLHMYGRALETLTERIAFDLEKGTCAVMDIGVKTHR